MKAIKNPLSLSRLERVSDLFYVFALLLLTYTFADVPAGMESTRELWDFYLSHLESFIGFLISFLIVAYYWINHQEYFAFFKGTDKAHTFIELIFLMILIFMPFMNRFYEMYPASIVPKLLLSIDMIALGLLQYFSWSYGTKNRRLIDQSNPSDEDIKFIKQGMLVMPVLSLVAGITTFLYPYLWEIVMVVGPLVLTVKKKVKS